MREVQRHEDSVAAVRRLRRQLFGASVAGVLAVTAAACMWLLAGGATPGDLVMPLAGAALALAAELLALDVAIRRVQRSMVAPAPNRSGPAGTRAYGV